MYVMILFVENPLLSYIGMLHANYESMIFDPIWRLFATVCLHRICLNDLRVLDFDATCHPMYVVI